MKPDWNTEQTWQRWLAEYYQTRPPPQESIDAIAEIRFLTPESSPCAERFSARDLILLETSQKLI